MRRKIYASGEMIELAKKAKNKKVQVYSFFPVDPSFCECQKEIIKLKKKLAEMPPKKREAYMREIKHFTCPRSKIGLNRYRIVCKACGKVQGYCWASDASLKDWCDFHYVSWTDGKEWYGCLTPHVSPITQQLCLECTCGQDTRDFRANMTLNPKVAFDIEQKNKVGREYGKSNSKFSVRKVRLNVLPFKK